MRLLILFLVAISAHAATTTVAQTIVGPNGVAASGRATIRINTPCFSGATYVGAAPRVVNFTAGAFSVVLVANDTCIPAGTSYTVTWQLTGGPITSETWVVPTSVTAVTVESVKVSVVPSPSTLFTPSQISGVGASTGQVLQYNGTVYAPASVIANPMTTAGDLIVGGTGGATTREGIGTEGYVWTVYTGLPKWRPAAGGGGTWGTITGTLSGQTDLQSALNAKEPTITSGTTAQYWRGDKSWQSLSTGVLAAMAGLYEVPLSFNAPLSRSTNTISCIAATGSVAGCLSATDWTAFNAKQAAGSYITALTGDGTASGPGSAALTLATVATPGTSTKVTFDAKGRITTGGQAQFSDLGGTCTIAQGCTGVSTATDDTILLANGTSFVLTAIPPCSNATTDKLLYNATTNTLSCGSDQASGGGSGLTSLEGLTGANQTFTDDTNVTIVSGGTAHVITWAGTLAKARQNTATVYNDGANTWATGFQDFGAATLKIPTGAGLAETANGRIGYDSTANAYKVGVNGFTKTVAFTDAISAFSASTASTSSFSATPTFSLADVGTKSPTRFEPAALTGNVTAVTFTNKTAGAKFSIVWLQDGTGGRTVTYGASATNTCAISPTASVTTTQFFEVAADSSVVGTGCSTNDTAVVISGPSGTACSATPAAGTLCVWFDSTAKTLKVKDENAAIYVATLTASARTANQFVTYVNASGVPQTAAIAAADVPTLNQSTTGNAATATAMLNPRTIGGTSFDGTANIVPATVTVVDSTDASSSVAIFDSATGDLQAKTDAGLTYNASTGALTATAFSGPLTGNVTGNVTGTVTGSSGSTTGNAATATVLATARDIGGVSFNGSASITPTQIQPASEAADTTNFPLFANAATGTAQQPKYNSAFGYDAATNALTATTFSGALSGNSTTATALAADPADCSAGSPTIGINASGAAQGCVTLANQTIQDEGSSLTQRPTLNFLGAGVTCADNAGKTECTITSGGGSFASSGTFTADAFVTAVDANTVKTPSATSTLDTSGNASFAGGVETNTANPTEAALWAMRQGAAPNLALYANKVVPHAPTSVPNTYGIAAPSAPGTGVRWGESAGSPATVTESWKSATDTRTALGLGIFATDTDAANLTGNIASARLPNPAVGAKGATEALTCSAGQHLSAIGTNGVPVCTPDVGALPGSSFFSSITAVTATAASATSLIATLAAGGSTTIPANSYIVGSPMQFTASGYCSSAGSGVTLNIEIFIGGSARMATGAFTPTNCTVTGVWDLRCTIATWTAGASGTQIGNCSMIIANSSGVMGAPLRVTSAWTTNTTVTQVMDLKATWSATTGTPSITASSVAASIPGSQVFGVSVNGGAAAVGTVDITIPHKFTGIFDGGGFPLTGGDSIVTCDIIPEGVSGTIRAWSFVVDTGSATAKLLRNTSSSTNPTITDSINTAGVSISTGTNFRDTTLTDFSNTTISALDRVCWNLSAVTDATSVKVTVEFR